ncbi:Acetylornithine aminotransferase [Dissulfuribacter thermophilus]|uniref:Acetylornithine aminotransferase n=1 Tax=Dissulfuribacter thermophilus TaxID=1156395 RepID=A0A1B9F7J7_9BACT|nr:aspartate aminotransferase family protein [Dissulfuribacter thermophilus]OCC15863.1 Acetylornithine aminotransferase [Dissulfuribacter thermophilus]
MSSFFENIADTYNRFPVTIVKGTGTKLYDEEGREFLDFTAGIAVCNLGHSNPELIEVAKKGLECLWHTSNLFWTRPQAALAKAICEHSFGEKVFFCNSGAEAVESAFKLMRRFGHETKGPGAVEVIALHGSFHGRTLGALSLTGQPQYQKGFRPLVPTVTFVPRNDIKALRLAIGKRTCGIILEPIQGEGGVHVLSDEFLLEARRLCDENGLLLCFDEVQVGIGRTGTLFAYEQTPVVPDLMCLAKALGNGLPIGALVAKKAIMSYLPPGTHASTFGGNPVISQVAQKVIEIIGDNAFLEGVKIKGELLKKGLMEIKADFPGLIKEVRGKGLIQAVEFNSPLEGIGSRFIDEGVLCLTPADRLLRVLPPLIIEEDEIKEFLNKFRNILEKYC